MEPNETKEPNETVEPNETKELGETEQAKRNRTAQTKPNSQTKQSQTKQNRVRLNETDCEGQTKRNEGYFGRLPALSSSRWPSSSGLVGVF